MKKLRTKEEKDKNGLLIISMHTLAVLLIFGVFLVPDYFGLNIGFALNFERFILTIICIIILRNPMRRNDFLYILKSCKLNIVILLYLSICIGVGIIRIDPGTILNPLFDNVLLFYVTAYLVTYEISLSEIMTWLYRITIILCVLGLLELMFSFPIFPKLETISGMYAGEQFRNGFLRIAGPTRHPIAYGLLLIILLPMCCYDYKNKSINIFKHPIVLLMIVLNLYFTGSRSSFGILFLELAIVFLFTERQFLKQNIILFVWLSSIGFCILILLSNTGIIETMQGFVWNTIDGAIGTSFSKDFGFYNQDLVNSALYRKELTKIFALDWLNPFIGRGYGYSFSWVSNGFWIRSIDNFYIRQYIALAYPGLISIILLFGSVLLLAFRSLKMYYGSFMKIFLILSICYFLNLWNVDSLGTLKYIFFIFGLINSLTTYGKVRNRGKLKHELLLGQKR